MQILPRLQKKAALRAVFFVSRRSLLFLWSLQERINYPLVQIR
ncbi:hypothetical protein APA_2008 [Pseudanabaena sp. lw0831]|nr:hypothetical protein APA_2008 [Pseudanabaena sp. lw0831]